MTVDPRIDKVFKDWKRKDAPGMAVAVKHNGEIIHARGYGMANLDHDIPIKPDTVFHCASLAKQFTAMSILLLAAQKENGRPVINLDDDAGKHVREMRQLPKISIRQLLHHTSGIRDMLIQLVLAGWRWGDDAITRDDVLGLVSRMKTLNFRPGEQFAYSNTNYFLAGEIVNLKSAEGSLAEFARKHIFEPLGMKSTRFVDRYGESVKNRAYGYRELGQRFEKRMPNYDLTGPTNLVTTVEDLMLWDQNFDNPTVGDVETVALLQKTGQNSNGYGLGLYVVEDGNDEPKTVFHNGRTIGHRAHFIRYNRDRISIALLCNIEFPDLMATEKFVHAVRKAVLGSPPRPPQATTFEHRHPAVTTSPTRGNEHDQYVGEYYSSEVDTTFEIERKETSLVLTRPKFPPIELERFSTDTFVALDFAPAVLREAELTFLRNNGVITGFRLDWCRFLEGSRLMNFRFTRRRPGAGANATP
jgi:CubicO group peptidase (beta-lactamase class C family)